MSIRVQFAEGIEVNSNGRGYFYFEVNVYSFWLWQNPVKPFPVRSTRKSINSLFILTR
jgi:hypothetical protein